MTRTCSNESIGRGRPAVDLPFLGEQCFGDEALQRELLQLFLIHTDRLIAKFRDMRPGEQNETAHRLKGSCQGIGAWAAADAAQGFLEATPRERACAFSRLAAALAEAETAIRNHLASF